ncbi:hypothetical protein [Paramagnetospirillum kuznetsovii]|uniref:hypothetical protein n=1 Tax=Paramagnetospirillum kuznetsovii TaxID=2053833 RepID=UPI00186485AA|nr:hypothetical protein [Paramagnetospirillum kuznetsovii]
MRLALAVLVLLIGFRALAADPSIGTPYTLYRNSVTDPNMRLHIATFDAMERETYNFENCRVAAELFQAQPGVKTKFWCEKGRFKSAP